jgi:allophanate hydrolase subunit 1
LELVPSVNKQLLLRVRVQQLEHHVLHEVLQQVQVQLQQHQQSKALQLLKQLQ